MSVPTPSGTWWQQVNVPFNDTSTAALINNSWLHVFKEMLKGTITLSGSSISSSLRPASSKWTVAGSGDGTTALLDGVDRLTGSVANSFDNTKWIHATSGTAHSWIVLQSPNVLGPVYFCIDLNSATTTTFGLIGSRQPFVLSAPLHTASRPITNNAFCIGSNTDPNQSTNTAIMNDQTTGVVWRAHILVDSSGAFHFMTNRNATGLFNTWVTIFNNVDSIPGETYPTFGSYDNTIGQKGSPTWSNVAPTSARCSGRSVDGQGASLLTVGGFCVWNFGGTSFAAGATADTSGSVTGSLRALLPYIQDFTPGKNSWRGRMPDAWIIGTSLPGDQFPASGSVTLTTVGDLMLPMTLSASL